MKRAIVLAGLVGLFLTVWLPSPVFAQCPVPLSNTTAAPALAYLNSTASGSSYVAWKDYGQLIEYTYGSPCNWQHVLYLPGPGGRQYAESPDAPAIAVAGEALYIAWNGTNNQLYYATTSGASFGESNPICFSPGNCAQTGLSPALAGNGLLYLAWTTSAHTIMVATHSATGGWSLIGTVPGASTAMAPALATNGALYVAWVPEGSSSIDVASLSSAGSWSSIGPVQGSAWNAHTDVAPALGVSQVPGENGLYASWSAAANDQSGYAVYHSLLHYSSTLTLEWSEPIPVPLSEASTLATDAMNTSPAVLGYTVNVPSGAYSTYNLSAAYTTAFNQIYWDVIATKTVSHPQPPPF